MRQAGEAEGVRRGSTSSARSVRLARAKVRETWGLVRAAGAPWRISRCSWEYEL